jgi:hypothetical protein
MPGDPGRNPIRRIDSVRTARADGLDWRLFDLGGLLDSLATRRYVTDPDARPLLGRLPGLDGLIVAAGFSGMGFKIAPAVGEGIAGLIAFVAVEVRSREPMVPLGLFRNRTFTAANLLTFFLYGALAGTFFYLPFVLIQARGYTPAAAGAATLPLIVIISALSRSAGAIADRFGSRLTQRLVVFNRTSAGSMPADFKLDFWILIQKCYQLSQLDFRLVFQIIFICIVKNIF